LKDSIGGLKIRNTKDVFNVNSRIAAFCYAMTGTGKTRFGATMDQMTKRFLGKPTFCIAIEPGEGGGTTSIREFGIDFVTPETLTQVESVLSDLAADTYYGGVLFDSSNEAVKSYLQPWTLAMPARENPISRSMAGVPARGDYQNMGEKLRQWFVKLINMTTVGGNDPTAKDIDRRKHVYVTSLLRQKFDDETGRLISTGPDLPGQMQSTAISLFQLAGTLDFDRKVEANPENPKFPKTVEVPMFAVKMKSGNYQSKDRYGLLPDRVLADWGYIYERYWLPAIQANVETTG